MALNKPDRDEIRRLADSLLLSLDEEQLVLLDKEFAAVIAQFERIVAIDTTNVEPTDFVGIPAANQMRIDAIGDIDFSKKEMSNNTASLLPSGLLSVGKK